MRLFFSFIFAFVLLLFSQSHECVVFFTSFVHTHYLYVIAFFIYCSLCLFSGFCLYNSCTYTNRRSTMVAGASVRVCVYAIYLWYADLIIRSPFVVPFASFSVCVSCFAALCVYVRVCLCEAYVLSYLMMIIR